MLEFRTWRKPPCSACTRVDPRNCFLGSRGFLARANRTDRLPANASGLGRRPAVYHPTARSGRDDRYGLPTHRAQSFGYHQEVWRLRGDRAPVQRRNSPRRSEWKRAGPIESRRCRRGRSGSTVHSRQQPRRVAGLGLPSGRSPACANPSRSMRRHHAPS